MKFSSDELEFIKNEIEKTPVLNGESLRYVKSAHPQLYYTTIGKSDDSVSLITEKSIILSLENQNLNNFICEKFSEPIDNLYMMHRLFYGVGGHAKRHKDRFTTHKTVSIILNDSFSGGDMYINNELVSMNKAGEYISFNGGNDEHEVKEIISGKRDVLIVWFSQKKSKFNLI